MSSPAKSSIEEQLALYRSSKRREEDYKAKRKRGWGFILWIMSFGSSSRSDTETSVADSVSNESKSESNSDEGTQEQNVCSEKGLRKRTAFAKESSSGISHDHADSQGWSHQSFLDTYTTLDWMALGLKCAMWMLLFKVFILIEFGAVFFIFSAFIFIWYNLRSGPKKEGEISAYSVFNPNCEVIEGTFTAEQFERELLHKMY